MPPLFKTAFMQSITSSLVLMSMLFAIDYIIFLLSGLTKHIKTPFVKQNGASILKIILFFAQNALLATVTFVLYFGNAKVIAI